MSFEQAENPVLPFQPYAEEVLCAGWNPAARLLVEPLARPSNPVVDGGGEVESLLARHYRWQQA